MGVTMRTSKTSRKRRYAIMTVLAVAPVAILSARGGALLEPPHRLVTYDVMDTAAIDTSSTTVGVSDGDLYGKSQADIDKTLDELQATGVNTVRVLVPWAGVEPIAGTYDWSQVDAIVNAAAARNMAVLGVLNSTPYYATQSGTPPISGAPADPAQYAAFASLAAARYAGKISAYEIWNEPNSAQYFQTSGDAAAAYTAILKAGYTAIKAADPNAEVVGGVVGSVVDFGNITINPVTFINDLYADGAKGYFDALSFHPYHFTTPFSQQAGIPNTPLEQLIAIRQLMIDNGDSSLRIWATEYGLPSALGGEAQQAQFVSDFLNAWSKLSYAGPSFIYTTQDRPAGAADPEGTFGIFRIDWSAKPVQQVIKDFIAAHMPTTPTDPTGPTNPPQPVDPAKAFAAAVAAFFQAVVKAYLNAIAQALANWGMSVQAALPHVLAAKAEIAPAAADAIREVASEQLTNTDTLDQVKAGLTAAADKAAATTDPAAEVKSTTTDPTTVVVAATDPATVVVAATDSTAAVQPPATTAVTPEATEAAQAVVTAAAVSAAAPAVTATPEVAKTDAAATTTATSATTTGTTAATAAAEPTTQTAASTTGTGSASTESGADGGKSGKSGKHDGTGKAGSIGTPDGAGKTGKSGATDGGTKSGKDGKDGTDAKGSEKGTDHESNPRRHARNKGDGVTSSSAASAGAQTKAVSTPAS